MVALLTMPRPRASRPAPSKPLERRMFPRRDAEGWIEGRRLDHSVAARRDPLVSLELRDLSLGGLAAFSHRPLEAGERVNVFFPPEGRGRGWDACGRVLRCTPSALGYRVALEFDPLPAA